MSSKTNTTNGNQTSNRLMLQDLMFENTPVLGQHSIMIGCRKCYNDWLNQFHKEEKLESEAVP